MKQLEFRLGRSGGKLTVYCKAFLQQNSIAEKNPSGQPNFWQAKSLSTCLGPCQKPSPHCSQLTALNNPFQASNSWCASGCFPLTASEGLCTEKRPLNKEPASAAFLLCNLHPVVFSSLNLRFPLCKRKV